MTQNTGLSELKAGLEAILMICENPVDVATLATVFDISGDEVFTALDQLAAEYRGEGGEGALFSRPRGFELREVGGGWRIYVAPRFQELVSRFVTVGASGRLSQAALETLAVVAYRQPCTRAQVAAVRGVNVDSVMRNLAARGLIEECGQTNLGALLYRTTTAFLEQSGLSSLDDLPPLAPYMPENPDLSAVLATDLNEILDSESADSEIKGTPLDASDSEERETHE
jgi:segregation and condensation protein B